MLLAKKKKKKKALYVGGDNIGEESSWELNIT